MEELDRITPLETSPAWYTDTPSSDHRSRCLVTIQLLMNLLKSRKMSTKECLLYEEDLLPQKKVNSKTKKVLFESRFHQLFRQKRTIMVEVNEFWWYMMMLQFYVPPLILIPLFWLLFIPCYILLCFTPLLVWKKMKNDGFFVVAAMTTAFACGLVSLLFGVPCCLRNKLE